MERLKQALPLKEVIYHCDGTTLFMDHDVETPAAEEQEARPIQHPGAEGMQLLHKYAAEFLRDALADNT